MKNKATLFQTGNDLSEGFVSVNRTLKADTFDVYSFVEDSDVTIQHSTKRGPSILVKEDKYNGNTYIAGIAYDVFNVWVNVQTADSSIGRPGLKKCIAEDLSTFDDAFDRAQMYIKEVQFDEMMILENDYID